MIDPDGEDGEDPFQVYCDMDLIPGRGVTMVTHTNAGIAIDVRGCDDPGTVFSTILMSSIEDSIVVNFFGDLH